MRLLTLVLALVFAPSVLATNESPFHVDVDKVLSLAIAAINERYPELSADDLALESSIDFHCWSTRPIEEILAQDEEFGPCFAKLDFALNSTRPRLAFADQEGSCKIAGNAFQFDKATFLL